MKKIIIIIPPRKLKLGLIFSLFIVFFIPLSLILISLHPRILSVFNNSLDNTIETLKKENGRLRGVLLGLYPDDKPLYENDCPARYYNEGTFETVPIPQVISEGKSLSFEVLTNDSKYLRPIYDDDWRSFFFRGWLNVPDRICDARHKLFVFYGGGSTLFDFGGVQSLEIKSAVDYHRNINFLVYDFDVKDIKLFNNQIILIGEPRIIGVQVVAIKVNNILPKEVDTKNFLFQIATPSGYEIDYLYGSYIRSEFLKEIEPASNPTLAIKQDDLSLTALQEQNSLLKKELTYYIPLYKDIRMTEESCSSRLSKNIINNERITEDIIQQRADIPYHILFANSEYKRPIYHPTWKSNYQNGWAYVPQKLCDALHNIFIIPTDKEEQKNLLGNLAFFEKFKPVFESEIGLLVYALDIKAVKIFEDKVFIIGIPSRTGVQMISIDKKDLKITQEYTFYLETLDGFQTDVIIQTRQKGE